MIDITQEDKWCLENIALTYPMFDTDSERVFYLVIVEMLAHFSPCIEAMVKCQEAVLAGNDTVLREHLVIIKKNWDAQISIFHKISVNQAVTKYYCDPVEWAKTVAKAGSPWYKAGQCKNGKSGMANEDEGVVGLSGLFSPMFHAMDCFIGRKLYDSVLGKEALHLRANLPPVQQEFFTALSEISVASYIAKGEDLCLQGLWRSIIESYAGERGFLGTHRYKVYGFLELAFKIGRTATNGDTMGKNDRGWEVVHQLLGESRVERLSVKDQTTDHQNNRGTFRECPFSASILHRVDINQDPEGMTRQVTLNLSNTGLLYQPGDRLTVMPLNTDEEVTNALALFNLKADENVPLNTPDWLAHGTILTPGISKSAEPALSAYDFFQRAQLRPLTRTCVESLNHLCPSTTATNMLKNTSMTRTMIPLSDLVPRQQNSNAIIWFGRGHTSAAHVLCEIFLPEVPRTYSIASYHDETVDGLFPKTLDLAVSRAVRSDKGNKIVGVGSGFLNPKRDCLTVNNKIAIGISRPLCFGLPKWPVEPIVMFAGGSGFAPFRSFLLQRQSAQKNGSQVGKHVLFLGVTSTKQVLFERDLVSMVGSGFLELHLAISREDVDFDGCVGDNLTFTKGIRCYIDSLMKRPKVAKTIWDMMQSRSSGGEHATFYVCGQADLFKTVISALQDITYMNGVNPDAALAVMFSEHRFQTEVYMPPVVRTTPPAYFYSEIAMHTNSEYGFWMVIDDVKTERASKYEGADSVSDSVEPNELSSKGGRVYDVTDFMKYVILFFSLLQSSLRYPLNPLCVHVVIIFLENY